MLHQISWVSYSIGISLIALVYYGYVGLTFYRAELKNALYRLTGKQPANPALTAGDLRLPDYQVLGKAQPDDIDFVEPGELHFGPPENEAEPVDEIVPQQTRQSNGDIHLLGDFSEMISETKTLIRVINESSESKGNFEMLFRLIVQKYPALAGSVYEDQVNEYLINEGAAEFPFPLSLNDLQTLWLNEQNLQSA